MLYQRQRARSASLIAGPEHSTASLRHVLPYLIPYQVRASAFIKELPAERGGVVKGWCDAAPPLIAISTPDDPPVLMVTISVADQCIQHEVIGNPKLGSLFRFVGNEDTFHDSQYVLQGMIGLTKGHVRVVVADDSLQQLIAVNQLVSLRCERLGGRSSIIAESRQFDRRVGYSEEIRHFGRDLLRPVFTGVRPRKFKQPVRSVFFTVPELPLAPHLLFGFVEKPLLLDPDDRIRIRHGEPRLRPIDSAAVDVPSCPSPFLLPSGSSWQPPNPSTPPAPAWPVRASAGGARRPGAHPRPPRRRWRPGWPRSPATARPRRGSGMMQRP